MTATTLNPYLREAVMTASPEQLQLMLYDGAIRFASQARDAILARQYETTYDKLSRAQAILLEMQNGLRPEVNPELCDHMAALYTFVYRKLVDACVRRSIDDLDEALKILRHMRETWVLLMERVAKTRADHGPQTPDAHTSGVPREHTGAKAPVGGTLSVQG